jgi:translation initiation factor 3 subunit M
MDRITELRDSSSSAAPCPRVDSPTFKLLETVTAQLSEMAVDTSSQVFVDGTFEDLAEELAAYIDNVKKTEDGGVSAEIKPLLEANKKDEALKRLVTGSPVLNAAPEKEFTAAYNLLVYLIIQSPNVNMFLPKVCENLSRPITSSPVNGSGLALSVLTTLFNLLQPDNEVRFNVFQAILRLVKTSGLYEMLRPQLKKLDTWIEQWDVDEEDQRKLFGQIADVADDAGEEELVHAFSFSMNDLLNSTIDNHINTSFGHYEHSIPKNQKKSPQKKHKSFHLEHSNPLSSPTPTSTSTT